MNRNQFKAAIVGMALVAVGYAIGTSGLGESRAEAQFRKFNAEGDHASCRWTGVSIPEGGAAVFKDNDPIGADSAFAYVVKADGTVIRAMVR